MRLQRRPCVALRSLAAAQSLSVSRVKLMCQTKQPIEGGVQDIFLPPHLLVLTTSLFLYALNFYQIAPTQSIFNSPVVHQRKLCQRRSLQAVKALR